MSDLLTTLERSRALGFLGPGPVEDHITHARGFAAAYEGDPPARALDLGSGGGVPGLVLASVWEHTHWFLLDVSERRTTFLREAVETLALSARVEVLHGRAEEVARRDDLRGAMDLVTARSFGPPGVTAECAAGFLCEGGRLIVSEPPTSEGRWDAGGLSVLGMELGPVQGRCQVILQVSPTPERYPRRVGIPGKRPLF